MKNKLIRAFAVLLFTALAGTGGDYYIENYTGNDIILNDSTTIKSKQLKTNINKEYTEKKTIDSAFIYLHHTVTDRDATIEDINQIHLNRGWEKLSYHFAIRHDAKIHYVNSIEKLTYHTKGHNSNGIAIALIGNYEEYYPTTEMIEATRWLIEEVICKTPNLYIKGIIPHKDATGAATLCPGKYAYSEFQDLFFDNANK